jgi:hypothetical protein
MTRKETEKYIAKENIDIRENNIFIGEKCNIPDAIGTYEISDVWYLYKVLKDKSIDILKSGDEECIFNHLYLMIRERIGKILH